MFMDTLMFVVLGIMGAIKNEVEGALRIQTAKWGETAILECPGDDKFHRFQYWLLKNDEIIGPWNNREENKARYEVWSGRLIIKEVSEAESGLYRCFSKKILGSALKSEAVELLVLKNWEESFDNDTKINILRAITAVLVFLTIAIIAVIIYCKKRPKSYTFRGLKEGSADSSDNFINNEVYRTTNVSFKKSKNTCQENDREKSEKPWEAAIVETDISNSFPFSN